MKIIFYRILGNDIPPRHSPDQTLTSLSFILKNEPELAGCEKRFMLNRIFDRETHNRLVLMLNEAGLVWHSADFVASDYRNLKTEFERALYLTNQNAARNLCIDLGLMAGDVVLPFDGQTFFSAEGWSGLLDALNSGSSSKYFTLPMFRLRENLDTLRPWSQLRREYEGHGPSEPQIALRRGYDIRFNEALSYGMANKVHLLMRLGVKGPWDSWNHPFYDDLRANMAHLRSQSFGQVRDTGFVFRLCSGNWEADQQLALRCQTREDGMIELVSRIERSIKQGTNA